MIRSTTINYLIYVFCGLGLLYACKEAKASPSSDPMNRPRQERTDLTEKQAIQLAEQYVKDNGYTDFPADKTKLSYELMDRTGEDTSDILVRRHNSLHPTAFCISDHDDVWHIGFLATEVYLNNLETIELTNDLQGRAVIVDRKSKKVRMAHKDPLFSLFRKLK